MSIIKILPEDLINKIAAGEVVERPASVVKELLDNAFDAKASAITVEIEEGGSKKIHIIDNGTGMDKDDALMAFKLHATSKIYSEADLLNISKYGFRGEALASIAAVSKITLKTRRSEDTLGTKIIIEGGNIISVEETGAPFGTSILVEDLFYNVPARKEFMRQAQTEYRIILDIINAHAMANSGVGMTFMNNGKVVYNFPKDDQLEERAREVLGRDTYDNMVGLFFEHPHLEIFGFICKPQIATDKPKNQYLFVNKRRITDKAVSAAVKEAYETLLPKTLYPQYIIFMSVAPNIVDVNVHPRKEEVRFSNGQLIYASIRESVKKALERNNLTPTNLTQGAGADDPFKSAAAGPFGAKPPFGDRSPFGQSPFGKAPGSLGGSSPFGDRPPFGASNSPFGGLPTARKPLGTNPFGSPSANPIIPRPSPFGANSFGDQPASGAKPPFTKSGGMLSDAPWDDDPADNPFDFDLPQTTQSKGPSNQNFLAIKKLYIVKGTETGITVYDQHAVHERINYEKLLKVYKDGKAEGSTQRLLTPVVINLSAKDFSIIQEYIEELAKAGFELEEFGGTSIKVNEVPVIMANMDIKNLVLEFIGDLESDNKIKDVDQASHKALTYLACRSSYKANDEISPEEIEVLLNQLETTDIKYTCPHGRPVKIEFSFGELEKMFKRTGF